jgi:Ca2+-binding EF-hand superfamily protein
MRNIIDDLFSVEKSMQKLELIERCKVFGEFDDKYDELLKNVKTLFTDFDEDFDHLLEKKEFYNLLDFLAGYMPENKEEIFKFTDTNGDGKVSYTELKDNFASIVKMIRIKNVLRNISDIISR